MIVTEYIDPVEIVNGIPLINPVVVLILRFANKLGLIEYTNGATPPTPPIGLNGVDGLLCVNVLTVINCIAVTG